MGTTAGRVDRVIGAGIRLNAIAPGMIDTAMIAEGRADPTVAPMLELFPIPSGGPGRPEEVAAVIAFLLGPDSSCCAARSCSPTEARTPCSAPTIGRTVGPRSRCGRREVHRLQELTRAARMGWRCLATGSRCAQMDPLARARADPGRGDDQPRVLAELRRLQEKKDYNAAVRANEAVAVAPIDTLLQTDDATSEATSSRFAGSLPPARGTRQRGHHPRSQFERAAWVWVATPFKLASGDAVLVVRGFLPTQGTPDAVPADAEPPAGESTIQGLVQETQTKDCSAHPTATMAASPTSLGSTSSVSRSSAVQDVSGVGATAEHAARTGRRRARAAA